MIWDQWETNLLILGSEMYQKVGDISVLGLSGDIESFEGKQLLRTLTRLIHRNWLKIILDFTGVQHVDYRILADMVTVVVAAHTLRGEIKLANISSYHRNLLRITGVEEFFETYESVEDAIMSFEGGVVSPAGPC